MIHLPPNSIASKLETLKISLSAINTTVTLVAVSKQQPASKIIQALETNQRVFGENRVQEAKEKWISLKSRFPDTELHLIGPLQTNKIRDALAIFDVIETLDRYTLAIALAEGMKKYGKRPACYIQVNTGNEPQKSGIPLEEADLFIQHCKDELSLPVNGLMCIPPAHVPPGLHFALLAKLAARNGLDRLSMGMSGDFETAVRFGATSVRVGSLLFGERKAHTEATPPL